MSCSAGKNCTRADALTTDITQLNAGDAIEVWGSDLGVSSGTDVYVGNDTRSSGANNVSK